MNEYKNKKAAKNPPQLPSHFIIMIKTSSMHSLHSFMAAFTMKKYSIEGSRVAMCL